ncbi:GD21353 [Drosophila simulans]|uniref:GD21353 n=1 Tax=Drosophila simulans TaxID=7240 RepID=B4QY47_DROSI|nr:GD21353 [Drosophila simulans]
MAWVVMTIAPFVLLLLLLLLVMVMVRVEWRWRILDIASAIGGRSKDEFASGMAPWFYALVFAASQRHSSSSSAGVGVQVGAGSWS